MTPVLDLWPHGHRSAVLVTVNVDAERALLTLDPALEGRTKTLSTAAYGMRRGVAAIGAALDRHAVPASWFLPGSVVRSHSDTVEQLSARTRDDVGLRGDDLENMQNLTPAERFAALERAVESFREAGVEPAGFRLARGDWPQGLVADLRRSGITWSSSWVADDLPFMLPGANGHDLVEIPFHYASHDQQAFEWNFAPALPAGHSRIASYSDTLENWIWEFEATRDEGLLWVLTLHPHIIGTPGRIALLDEMLERIGRYDDVWTANGSMIDTWWRSPSRRAETAHPSAMFLEESGWTNY